MILFFEGPLKGKKVMPDNLLNYVCQTSHLKPEMAAQLVKAVQ
jgi:hypothetical protein